MRRALRFVYLCLRDLLRMVFAPQLLERDPD